MIASCRQNLNKCNGGDYMLLKMSMVVINCAHVATAKLMRGSGSGPTAPH